jgi:Transposase DDE domain
LDHSGYLPSFIHISKGNVHDINVAHKITLPPSSILLIDRAYIDFKWFANLHKQGVFFITRAKCNLNYKVAERRRVNKSKGLIYYYLNLTSRPDHLPNSPFLRQGVNRTAMI